MAVINLHNAFISFGSYNNLVRWSVNVLPNIKGPRRGTNLMFTLGNLRWRMCYLLKNLIDLLLVKEKLD